MSMIGFYVWSLKDFSKGVKHVDPQAKSASKEYGQKK
jgi:hypothetical protein